ncbi:MAG: ribonuclease H family protein [Dysgonamonadaceae bacterium]|jgi:ribonuclease HI|nr:ribonuclease H family protein [Dysgonamonadaceae bacterium]
MAKQKFYVVWQGVTPGIYATWDECKAQVSGFDHARYKSFESREAAEKAFSENPWLHIARKTDLPPKASSAEIIRESLAVDAACSGNPGKMEYRGVFVADNVEIFHSAVYEDGTNNIGEFLAIVHALALLKQKNSNIPVYSDSVNAMKWIQKKKCNTKLERTSRNKPLFELIERAERWLNTNTFPNKLIKWETAQWGEIPADFGRK